MAQQIGQPLGGAAITPVDFNPTEVPYNPDDDIIARFIVTDWQGKMAYYWNDWQEWVGNRWARRDMRQVQQRVREWLVPHRKALRGGVTMARIRAVASMLENDCYISDDALMAVQRELDHYIPLENGLFDLRSWRLTDHDPMLFYTSSMPFTYDPNAKCPHFLKFLKSSLATAEGEPDLDMQALALEFLGYAMTADISRKVSLWLVGVPDSGKSTLLTLVRRLMGGFHTTIDLNQLATNNFMLASIVGKRCVSTSEGESNVMLPEARYKALVGGTDEIFVDVKNKPGLTIVPTTKLIWAMNGTPRISDRSGATYNRLLPLLFERSIPKRQRIANLNDLLADELPGIFNAAMASYRRVVTSGRFTIPERSERWLDQYRAENDTEAYYARERLALAPEFSIGAQALYSDYANWCMSAGFKAKNITQIAKEWRRLGLKDTLSGGRTVWRGAKIQEGQLSLRNL